MAKSTLLPTYLDSLMTPRRFLTRLAFTFSKRDFEQQHGQIGGGLFKFLGPITPALHVLGRAKVDVHIDDFVGRSCLPKIFFSPFRFLRFA